MKVILIKNSPPTRSTTWDGVRSYEAATTVDVDGDTYRAWVEELKIARPVADASKVSAKTEGDEKTEVDAGKGADASKVSAK
jgi:hypothetical protein